MSPPETVRATASRRNCMRMSLLLAPTAIRMPISRAVATRGSTFATGARAFASWQMRICDLGGCLRWTRLRGEPVRFNLRLRDPIENYLGPDVAWRGIGGEYVVTLGPESFQLLIDKGMAIKRAVMAAGGITHPFEDDLSFLYGTIFTGVPLSDGADSRNVCIFAEGEVDRSPTGTGVSGRAAIHHSRGEHGIGQDMVVESIIGSRFTVRVLEETEFGPYPAVIPEVEGSASITGRHEFLIDPDDPLCDGFILR